MPTDGLGTDEELSQAPPKNKEFEAQLMSGCSTIGVVSVITYFMTIWPFAVYPEYSIVGLLKIIGFGILPASILGAIAARRFALAGASGFFGGAMAAAVFIHLRLQQTMLGNYARDIPKPDYPESFAFMLPLLWFVWSGALAWIFCRREPSEG